jgi:TPR repeat protein|tara:strand:+ start:801 stop:1286 length:486 start_codon:yes stop_codon:yes gene_type:complete
MQSLKKTLTFGLMVLGIAVSSSASDFFDSTKVSAEQGDVSAQLSMGIMYHDGKEIKQDYKKSLKWFEKSANQGDALAQLYLSSFYYYGKGVRQDYGKAFQWALKSANQGDADAQGLIGVHYEEGKGVQVNKNEAKKWYGKSCDNGSQTGCDYYRDLNEQGY